jgi:hypothetical protein
MSYTLYYDPTDKDVLIIMEYLDSLGIPVIPEKYNDAEIPIWVSKFPAIETAKEKFVGIAKCVNFYENLSSITNLLMKAKDFKASNPKYKMTNFIYI